MKGATLQSLAEKRQKVTQSGVATRNTTALSLILSYYSALGITLALLISRNINPLKQGGSRT